MIKKEFRKLAVTLLTAAMAFSLSACGNKDKEETETTEAVTEATTEASTEATTTEAASETEASTEEITETSTEAAASGNLAEDFFNGKVSIRFSDTVTTSVDYGSIDRKEFANETEFLDNIKTSSSLSDFSSAKISKENYKLSGGNVNAYLLKYDMNIEVETYSLLYIAVEKDGGLEITFADAMWSRKDVKVTEKGLVTSFGSGGAGFHVGEAYVPDANFNYTLLYRESQAYPGYSFYDANDEKEATVNNIISDYTSEYGDSEELVYFGQTIMGSNTYYYFLGDSITQEKVDQIDAIASKYNFTFDGYSTVEEKIDETLKSLGAEDVYKDITSTLY